MATQLKKLLAACSFALAAAGLCAPVLAADEPGSASAQPAKSSKAKSSKAKSQKSKSSKARKAAAAATAVAAAGAATAGVAMQDPLDIAEPDITGSVVTEYACEMGNKITIYTNDEDEAHIALRWKQRLHRLKRIGTTTGALRFENPHYGLVWIGIPTKGILLDSKQNRQLANECKNAEQAAAVVAAVAGEKKS